MVDNIRIDDRTSTGTGKSNYSCTVRRRCMRAPHKSHSCPRNDPSRDRHPSHDGRPSRHRRPSHDRHPSHGVRRRGRHLLWQRRAERQGPQQQRRRRSASDGSTQPPSVRSCGVTRPGERWLANVSERRTIPHLDTRFGISAAFGDLPFQIIIAQQPHGTAILAQDPSRGNLTEPTAGARPRRRELVFMPLNGHLPLVPSSGKVGGKRTFRPASSYRPGCLHLPKMIEFERFYRTVTATAASPAGNDQAQSPKTGTAAAATTQPPRKPNRRCSDLLKRLGSTGISG
jgi:hypothetical protein